MRFNEKMVYLKVFGEYTNMKQLLSKNKIRRVRALIVSSKVQ